jgi:hypothetical protein
VAYRVLQLWATATVTGFYGCLTSRVEVGVRCIEHGYSIYSCSLAAGPYHITEVAPNVHQAFQFLEDYKVDHDLNFAFL